MEVVRAVSSSNTPAAMVGEILERDLAITAKILQVVNSAYYGLQRTVTSITDAVVILGMETVKDLALAVDAMRQLDKVKPLYFSTDKILRHNLSVAGLARAIAMSEGGDARLGGRGVYRRVVS